MKPLPKIPHLDPRIDTNPVLKMLKRTHMSINSDVWLLIGAHQFFPQVFGVYEGALLEAAGVAAVVRVVS